MKATFMAEFAAEDQKNMEFYVWYRSEMLLVIVILLIFFDAMKCIMIIYLDTGGRFLVLGICFGLLITVFCTSWPMNAFA